MSVAPPAGLAAATPKSPLADKRMRRATISIGHARVNVNTAPCAATAPAERPASAAARTPVILT